VSFAAITLCAASQRVFVVVVYFVMTQPGNFRFARVQWVSGTLSAGVKRPESETDQSPLSSAEIKNTWCYTSIPNASSWRGA
jgi:hypothetical protein